MFWAVGGSVTAILQRQRRKADSIQIRVAAAENTPYRQLAPAWRHGGVQCSPPKKNASDKDNLNGSV